MSEQIKPQPTRHFLAERAEEMESALGEAISHALWTHKRLGNPIATWKDGRVVIVPPEGILLSSENEQTEEIPEYLRILLLQYPDYRADGVIIANIGMKINQCQGENELAEAVITQCRLAWEIFNSIQCMIGYDYNLGAMILCRNLFEVVIGTIFLIDHPEKLPDFIDYGKLTAYELAESMGADEKYLRAFKQKADYDNSKKRLGRNKWHGQKTVKKLAEQVGMEKLYESFYKESSSIVHGDSYVSLGYKRGKWGFSKDVTSWSNYGEAALTFSFISEAILYHKTVHGLQLPFVRDIQAVMGRLLQKGLIKL